LEIVTEFVFASNSTITIPVTQQPNLNTLGVVAADIPQSIPVVLALCRDVEHKDRLKLQRAIARSIIEVIQSVDGFKYLERQAVNKGASDGTRFKYVCIDSLQSLDRKANIKKEKAVQEKTELHGQQALPTYDCGGAVHITFSTKRDAVHVVYKHNPIHRDVESRPANENGHATVLPESQILVIDAENGVAPKKRTRKKKVQVQENAERPTEVDDPYVDMATSPESSRPPTVKKRKKSDVTSSQSKKKQKKTNELQPPSKARSKKKKDIAEPEPVPVPAKPAKGKACIRCREKRIKCNETHPACNQCRRGLWTCQYEVEGPKKRGKNGCLNCRRRKRKCTEEKPSCGHCLKVDDDCEYAEYT
jgi:hypothetical protein